MSDLKILENRSRHLAKRQDLVLERSRRRDPMVTSYGTYRLVNAHKRRPH
jgi:hypothetical protein